TQILMVPIMAGLPNPALNSSLQNLLGHHRNLASSGGIQARIIPQPIFNPRDFRIPKHDPEGFYYSDWELYEPTSSGSLTCDLWRHSSDAETFEFEIVFPKDSSGNAAIECSIHAENLTKPVSLIVPVVMEEVEARVAMDALSLVDSAP
ncbi:MAG: hypothetical protein KDE47_11230, partial [Caldilineaceae bacterium]|nr:hypothetical protein [Caldilineaceae bacterium]